jgi:chemotaxis protein methyltransferase CheR
MSVPIDTAPKISAADMDFIVQFVFRECGIVLDHSKMYLVESRLSEVSRKTTLSGASGVIQQLRASPSPDLHRQVVDAMTTNETSFFRDEAPFEALKTDIIPQVIAKNGSTRKIRIWSAACSTGQESYSICMLLREHFPTLGTWNIEIIGTDISTQVLDKARAGKFSQLEVNRGLPLKMLVKYFSQSGRDWIIKKELLPKTDFRHFNLLKDLTTLGNFDIVFCRNVMIYFDLNIKKRMLTQIQSMIRPAGCLFLGGAETVYGIVDGYKRVTNGKAVYYQLM